MATQTQIETLMEALRKAPPSEHFQKIDRSTMGIRAILKYLSEGNEQATAGEISRALGVSTARVAVLLKKMAGRGLLEKQSDPTDGRVVVVRLSQQGREEAEQLRSELQAQLGALIDAIGMERLLEFAAISHEICSVMKQQGQTEEQG